MSLAWAPTHHVAPGTATDTIVLEPRHRSDETYNSLPDYHYVTCGVFYYCFSVWCGKSCERYMWELLWRGRYYWSQGYRSNAAAVQGGREGRASQPLKAGRGGAASGGEARVMRGKQNKFWCGSENCGINKLLSHSTRSEGGAVTRGGGAVQVMFAVWCLWFNGLIVCPPRLEILFYKKPKATMIPPVITQPQLYFPAIKGEVTVSSSKAREATNIVLWNRTWETPERQKW